MSSSLSPQSIFLSSVYFRHHKQGGVACLQIRSGFGDVTGASAPAHHTSWSSGEKRQLNMAANGRAVTGLQRGTAATNTAFI